MPGNAAENDDEAARWAVRLDGAPLEPNEQEALDAWLIARPQRRGALLRAEATLALLDRGRALVRLPEQARASATKFRPKIAAGWALSVVAASIALILAVAPPKPFEIKTAIGEIRRVPLADGSLVAVNTDSELKVTLKKDRREVRLLGGEAWFRVAHDKQRPFLVAAGPARIQAVGTAFSVRRRSDGTDVLVTEGVVDIWREGQPTRHILLKAGSRSFIADTRAVVAATPPRGAIERQLAWRTGELALAGESLDQAVMELNRYNSRKIVVDDAGLGRETLVGYFRANQPEDFARAVAALTGARIKSGEKTIHLSR